MVWHSCCLVSKSCPILCDPMDCSMPGSPVLHYLLEFAQIHLQWVSDAFQPPYPLPSPFAFAFKFFPASGSFPVSWLFISGGQSIWASASASVLPVNIQGWSSWRLVWSPFCPMDFQESSPAPQFKDISSLASCLLYGLALATVCDHWEDHSFDYMDLCQQSNVSAFQHTV